MKYRIRPYGTARCTLRSNKIGKPESLFDALCVRAGVRKEQGADARMIMEVLGHGSIPVTMDIYTFVRLDSQRSAFDRVGDALRADDNRPDDDKGMSGVLVAD